MYTVLEKSLNLSSQIGTFCVYYILVIKTLKKLGKRVSKLQQFKTWTGCIVVVGPDLLFVDKYSTFCIICHMLGVFFHNAVVCGLK